MFWLVIGLFVCRKLVTGPHGTPGARPQFAVGVPQLKPSAFSAVRFTSAMRTRRLTWFGVLTASLLTTTASLTSVALATEAASARAFSDSLAVETSPLSTTEL